MMRPSQTIQRFTPHATLAALGIKLQALKLFAPIQQHVHIRQKSIKYSPVEKLYDAFISILAGAHGLSEVNTRLRCDPALQRAFGRSGCADLRVFIRAAARHGNEDFPADGGDFQAPHLPVEYDRQPTSGWNAV